MKPPLLLPFDLSAPPCLSTHLTLSRPNIKSIPGISTKPHACFPHFFFKPQFVNPRNYSILYSFNTSIASGDAKSIAETPILRPSDSKNQWDFVEIQSPTDPPFVSSWSSRFSWSDRASFLLTFIVCTTSVALVCFVATAVPTLYAMGRAAHSFAKLADAAREELPSTMAAIRLSGMEISDLTLEMSDLSQEISEGVSKSAQAVQAAENGIRQIGALAREQTTLMIQERANLPVISLQPVVSGAAKKTSRALGYATRILVNIISGGEFRPEDNDDDSVDRSKM